ncbi:MAG: type 4a pilus biogenesis protein PilO [Candidatus Omnitrophota bacterium]|jgi:Tfp pilus assembly protein PilO
MDIKEQLQPYIDKAKSLINVEQNKDYIIAGATALIVVLYLTFILVPKFGQLSKASRIVNDLNNKINQLNTMIKRQTQMKDRLVKLREEYAEYSKKLPMEKEIPEFLEGISSIAKKSRVRIVSITPSELRSVESGGKVIPYYKEMPILITAKSGYHQLGKFISDLEGGGRFMTISNLRIQYDTNFPRMHNERIKLLTYVSVEDKKK